MSAASQPDLEPPHNVAAERALLGGLLNSLDPAEQRRVLALAPASDYFSDAHRHILKAAATVIASGAIADAVAVQAALNGAPVKAADLAELLSYGLTTANAAEHARLVREAAHLRRLRDLGRRLAAGQATAEDAKAELAAEPQAAPALDWPWEPLEGLMVRDVAYPPAMFQDQLLTAGTWNIMAGDPGAGKTYIGLGLAIHASRGGPLFGLAGSGSAHRVAYLATETHTAFVKHHAQIWRGNEPAPGVVLASQPNIGVVDLIKPAHAERLRRAASSVDLLVVDPLGRLHAGDESDASHMGRIGQLLDEVTLETGCCILLMHHFRKGGPGGDGKRTLYDLSGVRMLGANSKVIWLLEKLPDPSRIRLTCDKNNYGPMHAPITLKRVPGGIPEVVPTQQQAAEDNRLRLADHLNHAPDGASIAELCELIDRSPNATRTALKSIGAVPVGRGKALRYYTQSRSLDTRSGAIDFNANARNTLDGE